MPAPRPPSRDDSLYGTISASRIIESRIGRLGGDEVVDLEAREGCGDEFGSEGRPNADRIILGRQYLEYGA